MQFRGECNCGHEVRTTLPINPAKTQGPPCLWVRCTQCRTPTQVERGETSAKSFLGD